MTIDAHLLPWAVGLIALIVASHVRLETRFNEQRRENERRFERVEKAIGVTDGNGSQFVRRNECVLMERYAGKQLEEIKGELHEMKDRLLKIEQHTSKEA